MARLTGVEYHIVTHNGVERYVKDESIPEGNLLFGDPAEHIEAPQDGDNSPGFQGVRIKDRKLFPE